MLNHKPTHLSLEKSLWRNRSLLWRNRSGPSKKKSRRAIDGEIVVGHWRNCDRLSKVLPSKDDSGPSKSCHWRSCDRPSKELRLGTIGIKATEFTPSVLAWDRSCPFVSVSYCLPQFDGDIAKIVHLLDLVVFACLRWN